jgi:hypothetical protein
MYMSHRSSIYDPNAAHMEQFYAQMHAIEHQMAMAPLCLAHKVMARLNQDPMERGYADDLHHANAAATKIQAHGRGYLVRASKKREEERLQAEREVSLPGVSAGLHGGGLSFFDCLSCPGGGGKDPGNRSRESTASREPIEI